MEQVLKTTKYFIPSVDNQANATQYALKILTSGYVDEDDLGFLKGKMIKSICGKSLCISRHTEIKLSTVKDHLKEQFSNDLNTNIEHNCKLLSKGLSLPKKAWKVVSLITILETNKGLTEFFNTLQPSDYYVNAMVAKVLSISEEELYDSIYKLNKAGLIEGDEKYLFSEVSSLPASIIGKLINIKAESYTELIEDALHPLPPSQLQLSNFEYIESQTLIQFLDVAINHSFTGINLLIYGIAGTGKTEFSKVIAEALGTALFAIRSEGNELSYVYSSQSSSSKRLQYLKLIQQLISVDSKTLLLIDECEDIFEQELSKSGKGKDHLHTLLENNIIPTIWVTNHIDELPDSCLRRFSYIVNVEAPDKRIMEGIVNQSVKGLGVSKSFKEKLVNMKGVVPAYISNASYISHTLQQKGKQAEHTIESSISNVLTACGHEPDIKPKYKAQIPFSTEFINLKEGNQAIDEIEGAINKQSDVRVLLLGPSGTGKTALVNHLAQQSSKELRTIRASDVLDKYVGGSEKNIARIFEQANHDNCILFFDEIDSLLLDRAGLSQSYEIQQVNELLTHMECFEQPFFAATNFADKLDKAVMRRFDYKLSFDYLNQEQVQQLFKQATKSKVLYDLITSQLASLRNLTAGDFSIMTRRQKILARNISNTEFIDFLKYENQRKATYNSIGFI